MKADAIKLVTEALRDPAESCTGQLPACPGTVFVGPLDDADVERRGADSVSLSHRPERQPPQSRASRRDRRDAARADVPQLASARSLLPGHRRHDAGASEETPLRALGFVMQALQADPDLTGAAVNQETVHVTLEPLTTEEASRIWALFPTANYRTSIAYLATPVWIDPLLPEAVGAPVVIDDAAGRQQARGGAVMSGAQQTQLHGGVSSATRSSPSSCSMP